MCVCERERERDSYIERKREREMERVGSIREWSSLVEGDEESYRPNRQSNLFIALNVPSLLFCIFMNTTAYRWADMSLHLLLSAALPNLREEKLLTQT